MSRLASRRAGACVAIAAAGLLAIACAGSPRNAREDVGRAVVPDERPSPGSAERDASDAGDAGFDPSTPSADVATEPEGDGEPTVDDGGPVTHPAPPLPRFLLTTDWWGRTLGFAAGVDFDGDRSTLRREEIRGRELTTAVLARLNELPPYTFLSADAACVGQASTLLYAEARVIIDRHQGQLAVELDGCRDAEVLHRLAVSGAFPDTWMHGPEGEVRWGGAEARRRLAGLLGRAGARAGDVRAVRLLPLEDAGVDVVAAVGPTPCCGSAPSTVYIVRERRILASFPLEAFELTARSFELEGVTYVLVESFARARLLALGDGRAETVLDLPWPVVECGGC